MLEKTNVIFVRKVLKLELETGTGKVPRDIVVSNDLAIYFFISSFLLDSGQHLVQGGPQPG